jgi:hypothetical protein
MATSDPVRTPMTDVTTKALESPNPFGGYVPRPMRLDGGAPVANREPVTLTPNQLQDADLNQDSVSKSTETPPLNQENASYEAKSDVPQRSTADLEPEKPKRGRKPKKPLEDMAEPEFVNPISESRSAEGLPSYRAEFAGRDVFVGMPCYKTTNPVTAFSLVAMALDFGRDKIRFDMAIGDAIISHSRNRLAHKFLQTDAKWMLFIDDDILPSIGRPAWMRSWVIAARTLQDTPLQRHILHRLIGSGKTLIGGAYFGRHEGAPLVCSDQSLVNSARVYADKITPVDWVGTGAMLIHRSVFDDIRTKFGDTLKVKVPDYEYDYFRQKDGANGEDVSFCSYAKTAGHQCYIDTGIPIFHLGTKTF